MKLPVRILLALLCAAVVLSVPFVVSSPRLLEDAQWEIIDEIDSLNSDDDAAFLSWLIPAASAEEKQYSLPVDTTPGMKPNPKLFTKDGYEDDSIRVQIETREGKKKNVIWRIAWVEIASPTQLRTAYVGKSVRADSTAYLTNIVPNYNAIVAMNGDNYSNEKAKHSFVVRMGEVRQKKLNKQKDILIIDENGDFHTFINSEGADKFEKKTGHKIVNAFMFGPALVSEGKVVNVKRSYGYNFNPEGSQPRSAIGQLDKLSYVMVICDNTTGSDSVGVTHKELAEFMKELGCKEAYNLDGGNSAIMIYNNKIVNNKKGGERDVTDFIYFATAVDPKEWKK